MKQQDLNNTILTQYTNSKNIRSLIDSFNKSIGSEANIDEFFNKVFNIQTASSYGLDAWGEIVGMPRYIDIAVSGDYLGFEEPAQIKPTNLQPFDQAPFFYINGSTGMHRMDDDMYRSMILIKALGNISTSTVADISRILNLFFMSKGGVIVKDYFNMTIGYHFDFFADRIDAAVIKQLIKFVRPSGVMIEGTIYDSRQIFGFKGSDRATFGVGIFYNQSMKL